MKRFIIKILAFFLIIAVIDQITGRIIKYIDVHSQYGDAFTVRDLRVRPDFAGQQTVLGQHFLKLDGSYGEEFTPIAQWVYNYVYDASRPINFWLEYEKDPSCQLQLRIQFYRFGALGEWVKDAVFSEEEM